MLESVLGRTISSDVSILSTQSTMTELRRLSEILVNYHTVLMLILKNNNPQSQFAIYRGLHNINNNKNTRRGLVLSSI